MRSYINNLDSHVLRFLRPKHSAAHPSCEEVRVQLEGIALDPRVFRSDKTVLRHAQVLVITLFSASFGAFNDAICALILYMAYSQVSYSGLIFYIIMTSFDIIQTLSFWQGRPERGQGLFWQEYCHQLQDDYDTPDCGVPERRSDSGVLRLQRVQVHPPVHGRHSSASQGTVGQRRLLRSRTGSAAL